MEKFEKWHNIFACKFALVIINNVRACVYVFVCAYGCMGVGVWVWVGVGMCVCMFLA